MEIKKMKTAIVGCGMISRSYMRFLKNSASVIELVACADLDEARAKERANEFGIGVMSLEDISESPEIEMVINLTNPVAHYQITKQLLESGKHVYSEKMIAVDLEQGIELCEIAAKQNKRLGVAPDTFLGGGLQTAQYVINSGIIGQVTSVIASVNRDYGLYGDLLPHLRRKGGSIPFDVGCYYLTALASIVGPAVSVTGMSANHNKDRVNKRIDRPDFGQAVHSEDDNILVGLMQYESGVVGTLHLNSQSICDELFRLEIYGTDGILRLGDPNTFSGEVQVKKMNAEGFVFPYTHGYTQDSRGLGATEMAWAIRNNRPHRASMEMAFHVFEMTHGMLLSARNGMAYQMQSTFDKPAPLPDGFIDIGAWGPTVESALIL